MHYMHGLIMNAAWQAMEESGPCIGLLRTAINSYITTEISLKSILNPKIQYNYNNYSYIPGLLMAYFVVVDGELVFVNLEWCEYLCKPQGWFISYKPWQTVVY